MFERKLFPHAFLYLSLAILLFVTCALVADDMITREYKLTYSDSTLMIRVLNIAVRNPTGKRIMGGEGKRLVVTSTQDEQFEIADLLPIVDQPNKETIENRQLLEMLARASQYLGKRKKAYVAAQKSNGTLGSSASPSPSPTLISGVNSFDLYKTTFSIYAEEDAKIMQERHVIDEDTKLPSISDLTLKGIFKTATGAPVALMSYGSINYMARDGGLFERNRIPVKEVTSQVLKDKVILTGPDRRPREFKFKSTI